MNKINANYHLNDRIVIYTSSSISFWYKPHKESEQYWLFSASSSPSVEKYFARHGRRVGDNIFFISIKELYNLKNYYRNPELQNIFDWLPKQIEYIIHEKFDPSTAYARKTTKKYVKDYDRTVLYA